MRLHPHEGFDNSAASYRHIEAIPLAAAMGAEIRGVDVANLGDDANLGDETFAEIQHALFRHKMIFFRVQNIDHAQHRAFTRRFGPFADDAYTTGVPGYPEVQPVIKQADDHSAMVFGSGWHTDSPFLAKPPAISTLRAVKIPPFGGDTIWANAALAWRMLSPTMQGMLGGLRVHFSMRDVLASAQRHVHISDTPIGRLAATRELSELPAHLAEKIHGCTHPLLRTHPVTGEKSLYVDGSYAIGIECLQEAEAATLLHFLVEHITQPAFTCRLRWEPGTLTLWDNRLCVHQAFNDYSGHEREMYRTTIAGEKPQ